MAQTPLFLQDPAAVLDFAWDWKPLTNGRPNAVSDWLAVGETISSQTVTASPAGMTVATITQSSGIVTAFLSGGVPGTMYTATCHITTSNGRTDERSIRIFVQER